MSLSREQLRFDSLHAHRCIYCGIPFTRDEPKEQICVAGEWGDAHCECKKRWDELNEFEP